MPSVTKCERCEEGNLARRKRCACGKLVHGCCWDRVAHLCVGCRDYDRPADPADLEAHLARIQDRRDKLTAAIAMYETACCAFWDGDYSVEKLASWGVVEGVPSVSAAADALVLAVRQAAEDLGVPENRILLPAIEFPGFCEDGSVDYERGDVEALEAVASAVEEVI